MRDDIAYLRHILDAIARIESYSSGGRGAFLAQPLIQDAVLRNLEVIGEAVKGLSPAVRSETPEVPWAQIAGMRDVLIHEYFGVNLETVWNAVERRLHELKAAAERLLAQREP